MGDWRDDAITAGTDVLNDNGGSPGGDLHSWQCSARNRYPKPCTCLASVVADIVDEVAPIIRADEQRQMKANLSGVYAGIRASAEAEVRERIARQIEAKRAARLAEGWPYDEHERGMAFAFRIAARIARGEQP